MSWRNNYLSISFLLFVSTVSLVCTQQEHEEPDLDSLNEIQDKDPLLVNFLRKLATELKSTKEELAKKLKSNEEEWRQKYSEIKQENFEIKQENHELKVLLQEMKNDIIENSTKSSNELINAAVLTYAELQDCKEEVRVLRRFKRGRFSQTTNDIYTPYSDRNSTRNAVVPSINETALEQLLKLMAPATCNDWKLKAFYTSGYYLVDPDGKGIGDPPFSVYCDMNTGYSFVHHDGEEGGNATDCGGPGCHKQTLNYDASMRQIKALIEASDSCQQMVSIECKNTPLSKENIDYSWWTDRNGEKMSYWAGESFDTHTCQCGYTSSCVDPRMSCNCDSSVTGQWLHDRGYISNSSSLPITSVHFGSSKEEHTVKIHYQIGPLRCFGRKTSEYPESCADLLVSGVTVSGYYFLGQPPSPTLVYCNMEQPKNSLYMKRDSVIFYASLKNQWLTTGQGVKYDQVHMNLGGGYNASTGVFTCPQPGNYFIGAFSRMYNAGYHIRKNGVNVAFLDGVNSGSATSGLPVIMELEQGDEVTVHHYSGSLYATDSYGFQSVFFGMRLTE